MASRSGLLQTAVVGALVVSLSACAGGHHSSFTSTTLTVPSSEIPTQQPIHPVTWLCEPGMSNDACTASPSYTALEANGNTHSFASNVTPQPTIDCFYVYPTVTDGPMTNATMTIGPGQLKAATSQASRFSNDCKVYAPVYRQLTASAINGQIDVTPADIDEAYGDVLNAWRYYLAHFNHGRGVAFIGQGQGASMLVTLLRNQIEPSPILRSHMVSAILLSGNVTVLPGQTTGGTFRSLPLCTNVDLPGCVIAFSAFDATPPVDAVASRVPSPFDPLSQVTSSAPEVTACVNPIAPSAVPDSQFLQPFFLTADLPGLPLPLIGSTSGTAATTPWVTFPDLYRAQCDESNGARWLQVTASNAGTRPVIAPSPTLGAAWGLTPYELSLSLGNLVSDLKAQAFTYVTGRLSPAA